MPRYTHEVLAERVYLLVEAIPPGRVATYGTIADVAECGPRQVARLIQELGGLPWWRLVSAKGALPPRLTGAARQHWEEEGTPTRPGGDRVLLPAALIQAEELHALVRAPLPEE